MSFITLKDNKHEICHYEVVKIEGAKLSQEVIQEIKFLRKIIEVRPSRDKFLERLVKSFICLLNIK